MILQTKGWNKMLNKHLNSWHLCSTIETYPEIGNPVIVLVEHDVIFDPDEEFPFTRKAVLFKPSSGNPLVAWRLLDVNKELEEEFVQQDETVVAWRYFEE